MTNFATIKIRLLIMNRERVLITGASMGLGKSLAVEFAKRGFDLILTSLPNQNIDEVASVCSSQYGVECSTFEFDLTNQQELTTFIDTVNDNYQLSVLVNNAGIGGSLDFQATQYSYIETILRLNIVAPTALIHKLIPNLKRQSRAYILNISSMSAIVPMGYKTVYPASKAFLRHFSTGLRYELKDTGIFVSTAILGPMPTHPDVIRRIKSQGGMGRAISITPDEVARKCVNGMFKRKPEITVGLVNKLSRLAMKIVSPIYIAKLMTASTKKKEII